MERIEITVLTDEEKEKLYNMYNMLREFCESYEYSCSLCPFSNCHPCCPSDLADVINKIQEQYHAFD